MNASSLPDTARMASTMAANLARTMTAIDQISLEIDRLVLAAADGDWEKVALLSESLARDSREARYRGISTRAQAVCREARKPDNAHGIRRGLIRLIGIYGRTTKRQRAE